jgi:hypothetical protein
MVQSGFHRYKNNLGGLIEMAHICHQEQRFAKLEAELTGHNKDIQTLIKRLDNLTSGIWALVLTLIPIACGSFGFLIWQTISNAAKK